LSIDSSYCSLVVLSVTTNDFHTRTEKHIIAVFGLLQVYRLIWIGAEGLLSSGKVGKNMKVVINVH
jgi:hypothetical protein